MTKFIKFDESGEIMFSGDVPDSMISLQGDNVLAVDAERDTHYVDMRSMSLVKKPSKPTDFHEWDRVTKHWKLNIDRAWQSVRDTRASLLLACDWTQLPDVPSDKKNAWAVYRQQLRDITGQLDPLNIVWPTPPSN